jgi:hypothetical protein
MKSLIVKQVSILLFIIALFQSVSAEDIRDYYSEPGIHPFKNLTTDLNESIDPFSGTLQLRHLDISLPGNGGMDINLTRFYMNHQDANGKTPSYNSIYGIGWTMHFGRIVVPHQYASSICNQSSYSVTTIDNPSIEFSDGSRELLVLDANNAGDDHLITKSNWRADCNQNGIGLKVTAPDGTTYIMDQVASVTTGENRDEISWYTSEIRDVNNNAILISYSNHTRGYLYMSTVTGGRYDAQETFIPDGRSLTFNYLNDETNGCFLLDTVVSNANTWTYSYGSAYADDDPAYQFCRYDLTEVTLPSGQKWQYEYYPDTHPSAGKYSISRVTYPYGGIFDYTYQHVQFDSTRSDLTTAISTKTTSGPNITTGTWTYTFEPASRVFPVTGGGTFDADVTTIQQPNGYTVYVHQGSEAIGLENVWAAGLLLSKEVYDSADVLLEQEVPIWDKRVISNENYYRGIPGDVDNFTYAPIQLASQTFRNGSTHFTYMSNHDIYGNPQTIEETTIVGADTSRITNTTYYNNVSNWIIGLKEDEIITGIGTIDRTYNALGQLIAENKYGVNTSYTYTSEGDLETVTDARLNTVTYSNYYRGIAQNESHPESVAISRVVNPTGTVASITNGRLITTGFSYDAMNRLTAIDYPVNADVSISWTPTGKILTRGNYQETVTFDGFGSAIETERKDIFSLEAITQTTTFDALGQKVFESYPNSINGTSYQYDTLGRVTRITHPDASFRTYTYGVGGIEVTETDERNNQTVYLYRAFGHPDNNKVPLIIYSPESVCTYMQYNLLNQMTQVFQGEYDSATENCSGVPRDYTYNANYYLETEVHPETGTTTFGRDLLGNMTSRVISSGVTSTGTTSYTYDNLNRLTFVDYPGTTPDVTRVYDENNNLLQVSNTDSQISYAFDNNDNLESETIDIGLNQYIITYSYDNLDNLDTISYPSNRVIGYAPDALGRPSIVSPYVTSISYHPSGQTQQMVYANGVVTDMTVNNRLWLDAISVTGASTISDLSYTYDSLGNVLNISDAITPVNSRTMTYDNLNRLVSANGSWGLGNYSYDHKGNILTKDIGTDVMDYSYQNQRLRQIQGISDIRHYGYDLYGNVNKLISSDFNLNVNYEKWYTYDDAGNLRTAESIQGPSLPTHTYGYDGNGMRVSRTTPDENQQFVYAANSNLLGEYDPDLGSLYGKEYVYLGAQLIASVQENLPPTAHAGSDQIITAGETVYLSGSFSTDPDDGIATYSWTQLSGPLVTLSSTNTVETSFESVGLAANDVLIFELTVTDNNGLSSTDTVQIDILVNFIPTISITAPDDGSQFSRWDIIGFSATANDLEDGPQISNDIVWSSNINGVFGYGSNKSSYLELSIGTHIITASVTDSNNETSIDTITINVTNGDAPVLTIFNPINGQSFTTADGVALSGTASDTESGNLSNNIQWSSSLDGALGTGGTIFGVYLSEGVHIITASVTDPSHHVTTKDVTITITPYIPPPEVHLDILTPASGATFTVGEQITFTGSAYDGYEDVTEWIDWESNLDGWLDWGETITATLSEGIHTITAYVLCEDGTSNCEEYLETSITVNVNAVTTNTIPTVSISSPTNGTQFTTTDSISFTGTASDTEDGTISSSITWSSSLDGSIGTGANVSTSLSVGSHQVTASVIDSGGLSDSQVVNITVVEANTAPTVSISSPTEGASFTFGENVTLSGSATDTEDGDISVNIAWSSSRDGILGNGTGVLVSLSEGSHVITATVTDSGGLQDSGVVNVTVTSANTAPTVSITDPLSGAQYTFGDTVNLTASASDTEDGDISANVSWSSNLDGALGIGSTISPALSVGTHTITASITDSGSLNDSTVITLTINPVDQPPVVTITSPTSGSSFDVSEVISFTGTATDNEDGNLSTGISWSSSIDGVIGTGASFSSNLSEGTHTITASITDSSSQVDNAVITLTITNGVTPPTVYFDGEDGLTTGWVIQDNNPTGAAMSNVFDTDLQSNVIDFVGSGQKNMFRLRPGGTNWNDTQPIIEWQHKSPSFRITVRVSTSAGTKNIIYYGNNGNNSLSTNGNAYRIYLGNAVKDNNWHTITRNLQDDMNLLTSGITYSHVIRLDFRGYGRMDNVVMKAQ